MSEITCATQGHLWGPLGNCVMCGHPSPSPGVALVSGIGRDSECDQALVIYCSRRPTDDEMRDIHDTARAVTKGTSATTRPIIIGRVTGTKYEGDQCPGMPRAICHACGLGYRCWNPDCEQIGEASSFTNGPRKESAT